MEKSRGHPILALWITAFDAPSLLIYSSVLLTLNSWLKLFLHYSPGPSSDVFFKHCELLFTPTATRNCQMWYKAYSQSRTVPRQLLTLKNGGTLVPVQRNGLMWSWFLHKLFPYPGRSQTVLICEQVSVISGSDFTPKPQFNDSVSL